MNYVKARGIADKITNKELKKVCLDLVLVKENSGQNFIDFNENFNGVKYVGNTKAIHLLSKGYYAFYKYPYDAKAFNFFQQALNYSDDKNLNPEVKKLCLLGILDVYYNEAFKSNADVLDYLEKFKKIASDKTDEFYDKLHYLHYFLRDPSFKFPDTKFIKSFESLMQNFDKSHPFYADFYASVGIVYRFTGKKQKAIQYYKKALKISENKDSLRRIRYLCLAQLSEIYRELGKLDVVKFYLKEAEKNINKADTLTSKYGLNVYKSFYYYDVKKYKKAYDFLKLASIQSIQLDFKKNAYEIGRLNLKYQTEKKEKELLKAKAEKATTELNLTKQKQLTYTLFGGLALILLGGYALFQKNKRKHQLIIAKEKESGLQAIIQAEENERSKIARELHDGVVQEIGSVILNSRNALEKMNILNTPESQHLLKVLENSNEDIRNISHQMMPRALEELGLIAAVDDLLSSTLPLKGVKVNYEHFNITERLPQKIEKTLFRIMQELTNNILKHSKASEVSVQLFETGNNVMLIVEDNGIGIKPKSSKGIGLLNINSRLDMVKGTVNFEPSTESGTLVTVRIPLV